MPFTDRAHAGRRLAGCLQRFRDEDVVVLGLPRGGVPSPSRWREALGAPLDVIVVRKLGVPSSPSSAWAPSARAGYGSSTSDVVPRRGSATTDLAAVEARERAELERRARRFRGGRPRMPLAGRTVVVVDDGIATGATARAACQVARAQGAARVVLAVPVAPPDAVAELRRRCRRGGRASTRRSRSSPSASGTTTSPRPPTRRSSACCARGASAAATVAGPARATRLRPA